MARILYSQGDMLNGCEFIRDVPSLPTNRKAEFRCKCGNLFISNIQDIKRGRISSCKCYMIERLKESHTIHGESRRNKVSTEYSTWQGILRRALNLDNINYGGRGITVCERWQGKEGFIHFLEDMGRKPFLDAEVDRIDNDGNYCKENCKWSTKKEQANNKRNNIVLEYQDKKMNLTEWSEYLNIPYSALISRYLAGKSVEEIFNPNVGKSSLILYKVIQKDLDGNYIKTWDSCKQASEYYKVHVSCISEVCAGKGRTSCGFKWEYAL